MEWRFQYYTAEMTKQMINKGYKNIDRIHSEINLSLKTGFHDCYLVTYRSGQQRICKQLVAPSDEGIDYIQILPYYKQDSYFQVHYKNSDNYQYDFKASYSPQTNPAHYG